MFCRQMVNASMVNPEAAAAPRTGDASDVAAPHTTATYRNVARHSAMTDRQSSRVRSSAWTGISTGRSPALHRRPPPVEHLFRSSRSTASSIIFKWWSRSDVPSSRRLFMADTKVVLATITILVIYTAVLDAKWQWRLVWRRQQRDVRVCAQRVTHCSAANERLNLLHCCSSAITTMMGPAPAGAGGLVRRTCRSSRCFAEKRGVGYIEGGSKDKTKFRRW